MTKIYLVFVALFVSSFGFGQTTVSYSFSDATAVSGLNAAPPIALDANISFASFRNSGTADPELKDNQLRLYHNTTKGGSIIISPANGVSITKWVINASGSTGNAGYTVDGGTVMTLNGGTSYTIEGISASTEVEFFQQQNGGINRIYVDSFEVTYSSGGPATPSLTPSETSITNLEYLEGNGPSTEQSFDITGANLDGSDVTVSLPLASDFEIAETSSGTYSNSITLPAFDGTSTTIYARLKAGLTANTFSDKITISGGGSDPVDLALSGEVTEPSYCEVLGDNTYDTSITEVSFAGTTNTSSFSGVDHPSGYIEFSSPVFSVDRSSAYNLSVNLNTDGFYTVHAFAWIDWNQDFVFDTETEQYDLGDATDTGNGATTLSPLTITVPSGAALGNTRMRIVSRYAVDPTGPCDGTDDGEIEDYTIEVIAAPSIIYTFDGSWLPTDPSGSTTANDAIVIASGNATISQNTLVNSVRVSPGASITIDAAASLTIADALNLESSSTRYSSLIQNGSILGRITYKRFVNVTGTSAGGGNDLITPPLNGQRFDDFAAANEGVLAASGNLRAFAPFVNTANPGGYANFDVVNNAATLLEAGVGYRAAAGAVLQFTGTATTTDKAVTISAATGHFGDWNLIGNPYPSYIAIDDFLSYEVREGTQNIDLLDQASGLYAYNANASNRWDIISLSNASGQLMAPGQGFFVASGSEGGTLQFTTAMRRSAGGDDFISGRTAALVFLKLQIATSTKDYTTDFYFNEQSSLGLDMGYDAKTWGGQSSGFMLYSHLVEDNMGLPIGLQSLHSSDLANTSIPLGVHANASEELTFSIAESELPSTVDVYLEDTATASFTLLNTGNYTLRPNSPLTGTGRFFLRFTTRTLSTKAPSLNALQIYTKASAKTVVIRGQLLGASKVQLYDLQGRLVHTAMLDASKSSQNIDVSHCKTGVYMLKLAYGAELVYKKLLLR